MQSSQDKYSLSSFPFKSRSLALTYLKVVQMATKATSAADTALINIEERKERTTPAVLSSLIKRDLFFLASKGHGSRLNLINSVFFHFIPSSVC